MPIPVQCACGLVMEAPDESVGQVCECPQCKQQFVIPAPQAAAGSAASNSAPGPSPPSGSSAAATSASRPASTAGATGQSRQASQPAQRRSGATTGSPVPMDSLLDEVGVQRARSKYNCPHCREDVAKDDVICVSCGTNLETGGQIKRKLYPSAGGVRAADVRAAVAKEKSTKSGTIPPIYMLGPLFGAVGFLAYSYYSMGATPDGMDYGRLLKFGATGFFVGTIAPIVGWLVNRNR